MPFKNPPPNYGVWAGMRDRCRNPNVLQWDRYGGRGITVCERWNSFAAFAADMGERPAGHTLERVDNNGGYSPENCIWADRKTQQRNRENAVFLEIEGQQYRALDLIESSGLDRLTLINRAKRGMTLAEVLSKERHIDKTGLSLGGKASGLVRQSMAHCKNGHEFTFENTSISPQGWRRCRSCHNAKMRRRTKSKGLALDVPLAL